MCFIRGINPGGQRHRAQVINMPRLMSSPSIALAALTASVLYVLVATLLTAAVVYGALIATRHASAKCLLLY